MISTPSSLPSTIGLGAHHQQRNKPTNTTFTAPWNPAEPIEVYLDHLDDCYVSALIVSLPFTMAQMIDMAIMMLQVTPGLYSQALMEWEAMPPTCKTWDILKNHFTAAYNLHLFSGKTTPFLKLVTMLLPFLPMPTPTLTLTLAQRLTPCQRIWQTLHSQLHLHR